MKISRRGFLAGFLLLTFSVFAGADIRVGDFVTVGDRRDVAKVEKLYPSGVAEITFVKHTESGLQTVQTKLLKPALISGSKILVNGATQTIVRVTPSAPSQPGWDNIVYADEYGIESRTTRELLCQNIFSIIRE